MKHDGEKIPAELLKKIKRIELKAGVLVSDISAGGYSSIFKGQGMEFQEVREYSPGDDVRKIDWNVTARHGSPYIKRYKEERELNVMMLLDSSGSLQYGSGTKLKKDILVETAALLSFTALSNQDKIGAVFFSDKIEEFIKPSKQKNSILRLIRDIVFFNSRGGKTNISCALEYIIKTMRRRGIVFIFSDFLDVPDENKLFMLSKRHDVIPVLIDDIFEFSTVDIGLVDMIDNESGRRILVDTGSKSYRELIQKRLYRRAQLLDLFKKIKVTPLILNTSDEVDKVILSYFARRKRAFR